MTSHPCLVLALVIAASAPARADAPGPVRARDDIPLRARSGEAAPVLASIDRGAELEVIAVRGRWLRVRHGARVGWVTRTQVEARAPAGPRPRPARSGFSGKPREDTVKVAVEIDRVRGFDDPRTKASCTLDLAKGDVVIAIGRGHGGWILVEDAAGGVGWIPASVVTDAGRFAGDPRRAPAELAAALPVVEPAPAPAAVRRTAPAPAPPRIAAGLVATAGAEAFALRQPDALAIAFGPLAAVAAAARVRVAGSLWLGAAGNAGVSRGQLTYEDAAGPSEPIAASGLVIDASAELGWGRAWSVAARGGYHHAAREIEADRPEPLLAGEQIRGVTVGLGGTAPLGRRIALAAAIDVMPAGAHAPADAGIAAATSVRGAWARGMVTVRLPAHLVAALAYRGGAVEAALPDGATRSDRTHAVTVGLGVTW